MHNIAKPTINYNPNPEIDEILDCAPSHIKNTKIILVACKKTPDSSKFEFHNYAIGIYDGKKFIETPEYYNTFDEGDLLIRDWIKLYKVFPIKKPNINDAIS